jgi:endonuclease/exonuclease/phosphatase family metal-dependent hydrolase
MAFTRTVSGICVANLHATNDIPDLAAKDVIKAAAAATEWAAGAPLLFGGDLNLRPGETPAPFTELEERFGLTGTTAPDAIDHLLVRGLVQVEPPARWPGERREVECQGLALRLSDHAPVECGLETSR